MQTSDFYELNLVDGTDTVNPLIVDRPNYVIIDQVMHDNACASVGLATELTSGSVHAITRENPDAPVFRFIATANAVAGDTYTVDGVQVTALLSNGTPLSDNAYVINANVVCVLTGTLLTFLVSSAQAVAEDSEKLGGELPEYYAKTSDLSATSVVANNASTMALKNQTDMGGLRFGIDANGNYGYIKVGADSVTPFNSLSSFAYIKTSGHYGGCVIDTRAVNSIDVDFILGTSNSKLFIQGGSSLMFDTFSNSLDGVTIDVFTSSGSRSVDVTNYDYVSLMFYNDASSTNRRYVADGSANVSGGQIVRVQ